MKKLTKPQMRLVAALHDGEWQICFNNMSKRWTISSSYLSTNVRTRHLPALPRTVTSLIEAGVIELIPGSRMTTTCVFYRLVPVYCSHCGKPAKIREDGNVMTHNFPVPCRAVCVGSGRPPVHERRRVPPSDRTK